MTAFTNSSSDRHDVEPDVLTTLVARMARIGSCWSPSFAPDGTRIAFISNLSGLPQVWTVSTNGGWPELITALDEKIPGVAWSPDGTWLAFVLAPGGGMNQQIYLVRPDGSEMHRITAGGRDNNWLGPWSHDGQALALSSNRRSPDALDVYLAGPTSGALRLVAENQGRSNCRLSPAPLMPRQLLRPSPTTRASVAMTTRPV